MTIFRQYIKTLIKESNGDTSDLKKALSTRSQALRQKIIAASKAVEKRDGEGSAPAQELINFDFVKSFRNFEAQMEKQEYSEADKTIEDVEGKFYGWVEKHKVQIAPNWTQAYNSLKQKISSLLQQKQTTKKEGSPYGILSYFIMGGTNILVKAQQLMRNYNKKLALDLDEVQSGVKLTDLQKITGELQRIIKLGLYFRKAQKEGTEYADALKGAPEDILPQYRKKDRIADINSFLAYFEAVANKVAAVIQPGEGLEITSLEDKVIVDGSQVAKLAAAAEKIKETPAVDIITGDKAGEIKEIIKGFLEEPTPPESKEPQNESNGDFTLPESPTIVDELAYMYFATSLIIEKAKANTLRKKDFAKISQWPEIKSEPLKRLLTPVDSISSLIAALNKMSTYVNKEVAKSPQVVFDSLVFKTVNFLEKVLSLPDDASMEQVVDIIPTLNEGPEEARKLYRTVKMRAKNMLDKLTVAKATYKGEPLEKRAKEYYNALYNEYPVGDFDDIIASWKKRFNRSMQKTELEKLLKAKPKETDLPPSKDQKATAIGVDAAAALRVPGEEDLEERTARSLVKTIREHIRKRKG